MKWKQTYYDCNISYTSNLQLGLFIFTFIISYKLDNTKFDLDEVYLKTKPKQTRCQIKSVVKDVCSAVFCLNYYGVIVHSTKKNTEDQC